MTIDWTHDAAWIGTRAPLERCTGLDPAAYADAGFFELEKQRLFERAWVAVGTAPEVSHQFLIAAPLALHRDPNSYIGRNSLAGL